MIIRIDLWRREPDRADQKLLDLAHQFGFGRLEGCSVSRFFFLEGDINEEIAGQVAEGVLLDAVIEDYCIGNPPNILPQQHLIEVTSLPGVTDTVAENLLKTLHQLGFSQVHQVATGRRYVLSGELSRDDLEALSYKAFSNPTIHHVSIDAPIQPEFLASLPNQILVEEIPILEADSDALTAISQARRLSLNLAEMQAIQGYYQQESRNPTDLELEMLAQTWSEHCVHKTFKAQITYCEDGKTEVIQGLLNSYIRAATEQIEKGDWIRSAFVDNAGIVAFNDEWDLAFKVETHNHPSAIEPFGGANTGVGGVIRDVLGVSARPIANTDVLCFGPQNLDPAQIPAGSLHPRRVEEGVIHGVEDYGNKMGIPTVNGAVLYHPHYTANPLVFCGCLGLLPHGSNPTQVQAGDAIIVLGGATGRDGLRGATFSSMEMSSETGNIAGSAVQIGHPINEKQVLEVILQARDEGLYHAITDCGAGGLSSAVGEMASGMGARVQLKDVPLKYTGLRPWEIWLSEAQERMVLALPTHHLERFQSICRVHDIEAVQIGNFEKSGRLLLYYDEILVGDIDLNFLHDGIPLRHLNAEWRSPVPAEAAPVSASAQASLLALLAHPNIRSKESVIRRYDHEVQGGTCIKPLAGQKGHGDAAVIVPLDTGQHERGVAISNGICPLYGELDPYAMAWAAIDEALRNLVSVGADPDQVAILDNFCWGNPDLPDRLGSLVRCAKGCYDAAIAFQTPFISGKDSLNNEFTDSEGKRHAIPGTLLISALGIVPNIAHTLTADLKEAGNILYQVGETRPEMGASHYHLVNGISGGAVPQALPNSLQTMRQLHQAIVRGYVRACHDAAEGGIGLALAEMCIAGNLGAELQALDETALFSESLGRFIVEVRPQDRAAFEAALAGIPLSLLGRVTNEGRFRVEASIDLSLAELEKAWRGEVIPPQAPTIQAPRQLTHFSSHTQAPKVLVLHAKGSNRDRDAALACRMAGGEAEIVPISQLLQGERPLLDYHMLVLPGGFSYGDDLGAGVLWSLDLRHRLQAELEAFIQSGRPVLGICNGFQALLKSGLLLPDMPNSVTLSHNEAGNFECRWVYLKPHSGCLFTDGLDDLIYCPVAHGEGRILIRDEESRQRLWDAGLVALSYVDEGGNAAGYPYNPNGSADGIAGLRNMAGNVLGLMPHPENHIFHWQHPRHSRGLSGLRLFENALKRA